MITLLVALTCAALVNAAPQLHRVPMLDGRIVGGEPTDIEDRPYQASLLYLSEHTSGAVIISENYVVTAAHCTVGYVTSNNTQ